MFSFQRFDWKPEVHLNKIQATIGTGRWPRHPIIPMMFIQFLANLRTARLSTVPLKSYFTRCSAQRLPSPSFCDDLHKPVTNVLYSRCGLYSIPPSRLLHDTVEGLFQDRILVLAAVQQPCWGLRRILTKYTKQTTPDTLHSVSVSTVIAHVPILELANGKWNIPHHERVNDNLAQLWTATRYFPV